MAHNLKRFRVEDEIGPSGFTDWLQPKMRGYHLACCDCRLVHELEFRVVIDGGGKARVQYRARRAPRYTQQRRRRAK